MCYYRPLVFHPLLNITVVLLLLQDYKVLRQIANGAFGSVHCIQRRDSKVIHAAKYVKSQGEDLLREVMDGLSQILHHYTMQQEGELSTVVFFSL